MGCTATHSVSVTVDPLMVTTMSTTNAICGSPNGTATVAVAYGGSNPFYYVWSTSPVQSTAQATGLAQGTYYVTVTDFMGCTMRDTAIVNCVVGLADHASSTGITLIPNPSNGEFNLTLLGYNSAEASVNIFNVAGQCVYNEKLKVPSDIFSKNIDLSSFAKGVYYLSVSTADKVETMKLVTE